MFLRGSVRSCLLQTGLFLEREVQKTKRWCRTGQIPLMNHGRDTINELYCVSGQRFEPSLFTPRPLSRWYDICVCQCTVTNFRATINILVQQKCHLNVFLGQSSFMNLKLVSYNVVTGEIITHIPVLSLVPHPLTSAASPSQPKPTPTPPQIQSHPHPHSTKKIVKNMKGKL